MIRPSHSHGQGMPNVTETVQDLFQHLVDDVHRLMSRERKSQEREMEGRTNAMRTLRQLRDWILDRAGILTSLHSTFHPMANPRLSKSPFPAIIQGPMMSSTHPTNQRGHSSERSGSYNNLHLHEPIKSIDTPSLSNDSISGDQRALLPLPFATSTPRPSESDENQNRLNIEPISTLVEGVNILEKQLREYIHLEILLTDKFRFEMRMKQHQQKAQGFTPQGINEAQSIIAKLSTLNDYTGHDTLQKVKSQLERISMEYNECGKYMDKVNNNMTQIKNVDEFLKTLYEKEKLYKKDIGKPEKKRSTKSKNGEVKDSLTNLVDLIKSKAHHKQMKMSNTFDSSKSKANVKLPLIDQSVDKSINENLLGKLKLFVANYEIVRIRMLTVEDRFRRELCRKERKFEAILKSKEEDIHRLQTAFNEVDAEKEKYVRLYNTTKLSAARRK